MAGEGRVMRREGGMAVMEGQGNGGGGRKGEIK